MIPKIIHYCWFGRNPKPKLAEKCIKSWKKFCPDFEIIEWNEDNFDIDSAPLYIRQAYEAKRWAFVTDYVRLYAMTKYGGIYMDTDVEVIKTLDKFLVHEAFSGFEDETRIPTGIMACKKDFPLFKELLRFYDTASFYNEDGTENHTTNVTTITNICLNKGFQPNNTFQVIDGFALYPHDVFCPIDYDSNKLNKTKNTVTIHWFSGSWHSNEEKSQRVANRKRQIKEKRKTKRINFIHNLTHIPNRILKFILGESRYIRFKNKFKKS